MAGLCLLDPLAQLRRGTSPWTVDVASVVNPVDVHDPLVFVDPVDDAVLPDPRTAPAGELPPERVADLLWVRDQAPKTEFDDGTYDSRRCRGKSIQLSSSWR
jgi:hypothetical protein